jgi:hypothetical protein
LLTDEKSYFSFTCDNCTFRGNRDNVDNYVSSTTVDHHGVRYRKWSESDRYPDRCKECMRQARRNSRMRARLDKVWSISYDLDDRRYHRPKMITFALPSIITFFEEPDNELSLLKSKLPQARKILSSWGVLGGVYVPEVTTRSYEFMGTTCYKHHAHVHMVAIAPFIHPKELTQFSECLLPIGLGRINYKAASGQWRKAKRKIASYIAKYLCKEGRITSSFGIYRGYQLPESDLSSGGRSAKT